MTTPALVPNPAQPAYSPNGTTVTGPGSGPPSPVQYNIANLSQPQSQSASTSAPMATAVQNAQQAATDQAALNTFFGTGLSYAPQYEVNYAQVPTSGYAQAVSSGTAANPT
jgi:isochorismate hydrolase